MPISGKMYVWGNRAKNVSKGPGVYALYNADRVLIYMGVGVSLREKFTHYLKQTFPMTLANVKPDIIKES